MKKLMFSLLLCASLFIVTACATTGDNGTPNGTTNGGMQTTSPVSNDDQNEPLSLSNYRLVSEFLDDALFVSVDVEINYEDAVPTYEITLKDALGTEITELDSNSENPVEQSCKVALQNAGMELTGSLQCNSMFEIQTEGRYTLVVTDGETVIKEVVLEYKDGNITEVTE